MIPNKEDFVERVVIDSAKVEAEEKKHVNKVPNASFLSVSRREKEENTSISIV